MHRMNQNRPQSLRDLSSIGEFLFAFSSFPVNYWDKFVKKKAKEKYLEQFDEAQLDKLLGLDKDPMAMASNSYWY